MHLMRLLFRAASVKFLNEAVENEHAFSYLRSRLEPNGFLTFGSVVYQTNCSIV